MLGICLVKRALICALGLFATVPAIASSGDPTSGNLVLFPGELPADNYGGSPKLEKFDGWNIPGRYFREGAGWWVFACAKSCTLTPAKMTIRTGTHPDYDGPPLPSQILSWQPLPYDLDKAKQTPEEDRSRTRRPDDPILLAIFKPVGPLVELRLSAGEVKTWLHHGMEKYPVTKSRVLETPISEGAGMIAVIRQRLLAIKPQQEGGEDKRLLIELQVGNIRQTLDDYGFHMEAPGFISPKKFLLWVGDLDGDGKPDLLLNTTSYWWNTTLYLSSLAKSGELVGKAGQYSFSPPDSPGC